MNKWDNDMLAYVQTFRSALDFYAEESNYSRQGPSAESIVQQDAGKRARDIVKDLRMLEDMISKHENGENRE